MDKMVAMDECTCDGWTGVCVFYTMNRYFYPSTPTTTSALVNSSILQEQRDMTSSVVTKTTTRSEIVLGSTGTTYTSVQMRGTVGWTV